MQTIEPKVDQLWLYYQNIIPHKIIYIIKNEVVGLMFKNNPPTEYNMKLFLEKWTYIKTIGCEKCKGNLK